MTLLDVLRVALVALRLNMLRSVLTTLGIVIGVALVIVMVAVGSGARQSVEGFIKSLGSDLLMVSPGAGGFGSCRSAVGTALLLSERDRDNLVVIPMNAMRAHYRPGGRGA